MAMGNQIQMEVPESLRKQLALAVRSIQWSYAIFWSVSATQPGVLEWGDGYYNGDVKTAKTVQAIESNIDHLELQRSDQLRELYVSLLAGETIPLAEKPAVALSPEDLTDAEWYFLVNMSFIFKIGQGLPGRTLAENQIIWLCNAHLTDTKVFSHSLLAKTIVCFPHFGGVVELGATQLVLEDLNLIQHIKTSFLESPCPVFSRIPDNIINSNDLVCEVLDRANVPENDLDQPLDCPTKDSNDFADGLLRGELNLVEGIDGEVLRMQSCPFMDDTISNCINNSMHSSDCKSQYYENPNIIVPLPDGKKVINNCINEVQECKQQKQNTSGLQRDDIHYQSVLSNLLNGSNQLILGSYFRNGNRESSFVTWKNGLLGVKVPQTVTPQRLVKKVLVEVARMHGNFWPESGKYNGKRDGLSRLETDDIDKNHVLSRWKLREKLNKRFMVLGSLIPSGGKVDKVSVPDHTIDYLRELKRNVQELECYKKAMNLESMRRRKPRNAIERTSDNYGPNETCNIKKSLTNKRKSCDMDKMGAENKSARPTDSSIDSFAVSVTNKDVLIEIMCSWRDCAVIEVMEAISKLHLESQTVQSSNTDGILSLTIKAKCKGMKVASAAEIRQALQKVIHKC